MGNEGSAPQARNGAAVGDSDDDVDVESQVTPVRHRRGSVGSRSVASDGAGAGAGAGAGSGARSDVDSEEDGERETKGGRRSRSRSRSQSRSRSRSRSGSRARSRSGSRAQSRPTTGASAPGSRAGDSGEYDSEDDLDEAEATRRRNLDIRDYEYDPEQVEELIMLSGLTEAEIAKLFKRFFNATKMSSNPSLMRKRVFLRLPEIAANPLKHRIAHVFGFDQPQHREQGINFGTFVQKLSIFSEKSTTAEKIRASFDMYDLDGSGKISRENLQDMVSLVVDLGAARTEAQAELHRNLLATAVDKVFIEASSDKDLQYISFEDFRAILLSCSDFQAKFVLRLI